MAGNIKHQHPIPLQVGPIFKGYPIRLSHRPWTEKDGESLWVSWWVHWERSSLPKPNEVVRCLKAKYFRLSSCDLHYWFQFTQRANWDWEIRSVFHPTW